MNDLEVYTFDIYLTHQLKSTARSRLRQIINIKEKKTMTMPTAEILISAYEEDTTKTPKASLLQVYCPAPASDGSDLPALLTLWDNFRTAVLAVCVGQVIYHQAYGIRVDVAPRTTGASSDTARTWEKYRISGHSIITAPSAGFGHIEFSIPCANLTGTVLGGGNGMDSAFFAPIQTAANAFVRDRNGNSVVFTDAEQLSYGGKV